MAKPRILIQMDPDPHPSVFDSVVAIDADVDQLLRHAPVGVDDVEPLVHGAIFTRGPGDLKHTAIFVGGNDVAQAEAILARIQATFFGPMRVSVMLDANGCNTTAAAAVLSAQRHRSLSDSRVAVLGGTGPVGQRIARLAARQGAQVHVGSRSRDRAEAVCQSLKQRDPAWNLIPFASQGDDWIESIRECDMLFGAGAAGYELISESQLESLTEARILIDLNAVPPAGIAGVDVMAAGAQQGERVVYGAIGVGGLKMKIHKAAIRRLFEANDQILDAEDVFDLGVNLLET